MSFSSRFVLHVGFDFSSSCVGLGAEFVGSFASSVNGVSNGFASGVSVGFYVSSSRISGCFCSVLGAFRASGERESSGRSGSEKSDLAHIEYP